MNNVEYLGVLWRNKIHVYCFVLWVQTLGMTENGYNSKVVGQAFYRAQEGKK